jgi:hypothetical protein
MAEKVEPKGTVNPVFNIRALHMKQTLPFPVIFLPLLFLILAGVTAMAQDSIPAAQKIRIFFANNVHAELSPCG